MKQIIVFLPFWSTFALYYVLVPFTLINLLILLIDGEPLWNFLWADGDASFVDFWIDIQSWYVWLVQKSVIGLNKKAFDVENSSDLATVSVLSYYLLGPFMLPSIMAWWFLWFPVALYFLAKPEDFADEDGKVLPGFPTLVARTRDLLSMLLFTNGPFLAHTGPDAELTPLVLTDFIVGIVYILLYWIIA